MMITRILNKIIIKKARGNDGTLTSYILRDCCGGAYMYKDALKIYFYI